MIWSSEPRPGDRRRTGHGNTVGVAGGGSDSDNKVEKGKKSAKNPLAVNESAGLDVVIFDGGFGDKYAKDAQSEYLKAFPKADGR